MATSIEKSHRIAKYYSESIRLDYDNILTGSREACPINWAKIPLAVQNHMKDADYEVEIYYNLKDKLIPLCLLLLSWKWRCVALVRFMKIPDEPLYIVSDITNAESVLNINKAVKNTIEMFRIKCLIASYMLDAKENIWDKLLGQ